MIQDISVQHGEWIRKLRKVWKKEWVSSVTLSQYYNTKLMRKYCDRSLTRHAIRFDIEGTIKYWFHKDTVEQIKEKCRKVK